ncbi:MAG TPA: outer membrane beta-barrel protein [bacterium]|nr:outer membrane beta-barrel protein [bacterium]HQG47263.1 outer membrane beta-barrel protein [bacterium]HQI49546.1 outer membrane beta-barrel protein [bacterium]HQJ65576.1 outer membrane beta-barrel protein [bacterium]
MRKPAVVVATLVLCWMTAVTAQTESWGLGAHLLVSLPQKGFDNLSKDGEGIGGKAFYRLSPFLALRSDLGYLSYGERRNSEWSSGGYYFVTRRNESFQFTMGPQLTRRIGRVTPYAAVLGGFYYYHTVTSYEDYYSYYYDYYPYTNSSNGQSKWGWNLSTGVLIDLGIGVHLDFGYKLQNIHNAETTLKNITTKQTGVDYIITLGAVFFRN